MLGPQSNNLQFGSNLVNSHSVLAHKENINRLVRLQREVACVPRPTEIEGEGGRERQPNFCSATLEFLTACASRKQGLKAGFTNEEDTGLGPTMELYGLLATKLIQVLRKLIWSRKSWASFATFWCTLVFPLHDETATFHRIRLSLVPSLNMKLRRGLGHLESEPSWEPSGVLCSQAWTCRLC